MVTGLRPFAKLPWEGKWMWYSIFSYCLAILGLCPQMHRWVGVSKLITCSIKIHHPNKAYLNSSLICSVWSVPILWAFHSLRPSIHICAPTLALRWRLLDIHAYIIKWHKHTPILSTLGNLVALCFTAITCILPMITFLQICSVVAFSQTLRRYTSLNHLAQAARAVLQNPSQISQMLTDLNRVDFANVQVKMEYYVIFPNACLWLMQDVLIKRVLCIQNTHSVCTFPTTTNTCMWLGNSILRVF